MLILYGAVLLVMVALNVFLALIIRQMVVITGRQVQMHFSRKLEDCTDALDKTLEQLREAEQELARTRQLVKEQEESARKTGIPESAQAAPEHAGTGSLFYQAGVSYRNQEILETYQYIKEHMQLDYDGLLEELQQQSQEPNADWILCGRILEKVDFSVLYQLTTSPREKRRELLSELLTREEQEALERIAPEKELKDPVKRFDRVRQYRMLHDPQVRVRCGQQHLDHRVKNGAVITYDPQIHEGIQLRMGTGLLDYSL